MLKSNLTLQPNRISEAAIHASRQMWLASLGAAVVTRDWVQSEAGGVFKTLVKEGTVIESRAIRFVGDRIETSVSFANSVWKETRKTVESTVKQAAETTVALAQQVLPKTLPRIVPPFAAAPVSAPKKSAAKVAKKVAAARKPRVTKGKRVVKSARKA